MANRRIAMYEYRQIIYRLRKGQSNRAIAQSTFVGRNKVREVREIAKQQGWLNDDRSLPTDDELKGIFEKQTCSHEISKVEPF